jgi:hypothetical protein
MNRGRDTNARCLFTVKVSATSSARRGSYWCLVRPRLLPTDFLPRQSSALDEDSADAHHTPGAQPSCYMLAPTWLQAFVPPVPVSAQEVPFHNAATCGPRRPYPQLENTVCGIGGAQPKATDPAVFLERPKQRRAHVPHMGITSARHSRADHAVEPSHSHSAGYTS